jgi:hypothetical protein
MLAHRKIVWKRMALPKDEAHSEQYTQRIANAFFCSVTIFSVAFAYLVLWMWA